MSDLRSDWLDSSYGREVYPLGSLAWGWPPVESSTEGTMTGKHGWVFLSQEHRRFGHKARGVLSTRKRKRLRYFEIYSKKRTRILEHSRILQILFDAG